LDKKQLVKIAAIQLNMAQCFTEKIFFNFIERIFKINAFKYKADVLVFPEDISFCLAWVKESNPIAQKSVKTFLEKMSDIILSKIKLDKMGLWLSQNKIERIIRKTFTVLSKKYNVVVVAGSIYVQRDGDIYNSSLVFDNGEFVGEYLKQELVPLEVSWGVKSNTESEIIKTSKGNIGVAICYDLNHDYIIKELKEKGANYIVAPSSGWRPWPNYPFDEKTERPQLQRAKDNNIAIIRPYCCGFIIPGLFFQGKSQIVDENGIVVAESKSVYKEEFLIFNMEV
jgi:predicted amidohydrolase